MPAVVRFRSDGILAISQPTTLILFDASQVRQKLRERVAAAPHFFAPNLASGLVFMRPRENLADADAHQPVTRSCWTDSSISEAYTRNPPSASVLPLAKGLTPWS